MIGKSLWVRTFLVAVGILATMGMNINRIHTIGGFDNAAENNTHLLDRSYGSGGLLNGSMDRMPYDLGKGFDVRNDSITDMYVRNSINSGMDLPQVMDMKSEMFSFKENINKLKPVRIKREGSNDGNNEGNNEGNIKGNNEEITDASFILQSLALSNFSERCISLNKEIMDLYSKSDSDKQISKHLLHKFSFHFDQFDINGGVNIEFITVERRENAKSIFFALTNIANKVGNSIVMSNQNETNTHNTKALQNAKKIFELSSDKLIRMLIKIPNYTKNREGVLVDYFNVGALSCNPICGDAIEHNYSDRNLIITEANNAKNKLLTLYDGTNNRCDEIRGKSNISKKLYKDISKLIEQYGKEDMNLDQSNEFLIEQFTAMKNKIYIKLQDKTLCLALKSCCSMRSLLKYLSKTAVVIDDACGVEGQTEPENVSYDFYTSMRKISIQSKDIIIRLITKIDECRTNSLETKKDNAHYLLESQEVFTTTISSGNQNTSGTWVVTNHERNNISSNIPSSAANDPSLKKDSEPQSTNESSSVLTENAKASSGHLHSSVASNSLIGLLFFLLAKFIQRFQ